MIIKRKSDASYIIEKHLIEPNIKDWYEKRKTEIRASHLMIRPDSSGEAAARKFSQAILDSIKAGKSFEEMVAKYSQDNFSKPKGGDIFYFTAGQLPFEFEDAAIKQRKTVFIQGCTNKIWFSYHKSNR